MSEPQTSADIDPIGVAVAYLRDSGALLGARAIEARIAELEAALDDLHMHASPGAPGWIMVPFTEWVQVFTRVGFPVSDDQE